MQDNVSNPQLPRIGLSQGDFNGIAYEIMLKAFSDVRMYETLMPVLYGQSKVFSYYKKNFGMETPNYSLTRDVRQAFDKKFNIINIVENELKIEPGTPSSTSAEMSVLSMKKATDDLQNGFIDALVMAPDNPVVAKSNRDFLLSFHKDAAPIQVLVNGQMRIGLATGDVPLSTALEQIDSSNLVDKLTTLSNALKTDFGIFSPKIAVMGLNPHSGSLPIGDDEKVVNAVSDAQKKGLFLGFATLCHGLVEEIRCGAGHALRTRCVPAEVFVVEWLCLLLGGLACGVHGSFARPSLRHRQHEQGHSRLLS